MTDSIHIISAGESIHKTYPVAIKKELKDITRTYVIVEKGVFFDSLDDDEKKHAAKKAIQAAIEKVERISKEMDIPFHQKIIDTISIENVRDAVFGHIQRISGCSIFLQYFRRNENPFDRSFYDVNMDWWRFISYSRRGNYPETQYP